MSGYGWGMTLGSVLIFALYGWRCAAAGADSPLRKRPWITALLSLLFAAAFGLVLARVGYALLMQELDFEYDGWEALEQLWMVEFDLLSFFCGAVGALLGVMLANRLTRPGTMPQALDAFAPFGALLVALFRFGEAGFGSYNAGEMLPEGSALARFPFALEITVDGGYSYWAWAICILSACFALIWAAISFFALRDRGRPGWNFTMTLFFLCLPQMLCESLRRGGMYWLFVHVEQLLCGLVVLGVLFFWCLRAPGERSFPARFAPLGSALVGVGLLVVLEFAIDGKIFDFSHALSYGLMCLLLVGMGAAGWIAQRRWNESAGEAKA